MTRIHLNLRRPRTRYFCTFLRSAPFNPGGYS